MSHRLPPRSHRAIGLGAVLIALCLSALPTRAARADDRTDLASCLRESGTRFYGAHWCPYCRKQKERFGDAASLLPYVECYGPGTRDRRSLCRDIRSFPTWVFPDGTVRTGNLPLSTLARHADCDAPD